MPQNQCKHLSHLKEIKKCLMKKKKHSTLKHLNFINTFMHLSPNEYLSIFPVATGSVRIMYTDYSSALILQCFKELSDGTCASGHGSVRVVSRTHSIALSSRQKMKKILNEACISENDMILTPHVVDCPVGYTGRKSCRVDDIITQENYDITKLYGTWHLLAKTDSAIRNLQTTVKFSMGQNNLVRLVLATKRRDDSCVSAISHMNPVKDSNATYTYKYGVTKALSKVLFLTASYLVKYDCDGASLDEHGMCPPDREEIEIWGKSSFITETVVQELLSNVRTKTCVNTEHFEMTPVPENKCHLPEEACNFYDFVEAENFDSSSLYGGWQLLVRTTLVDLGLTSLSSLMVEGDRSSKIEYAVTGNLRSGDCFSKIGELTFDPVHPATSYTTSDHGAQVTSKTLYVTDNHLIVIQCRDAPDEHGVCATHNTELDIYGRRFDHSRETRQKLIDIAHQRTLGCVPTIAMMDVPPNKNCEIDQDYCTVDYFQVAENFDQRNLYGSWYPVIRSTFRKSIVVSLGVRYGHGLDNTVVHSVGALKNDGECLASAGHTLRPVDGEPATFHTEIDGIEWDIKILHLTPDHLILYYCFGGWKDSHHCTLENTQVDILTKGTELSVGEENELISLIREKALSCVPTSSFVKLLPTDCPVPPSGGRESCKFDDIHEVENFDPSLLSGGWYLIARTDTLPDLKPFDGGAVFVEVKGHTVTVNATVYHKDKPEDCLSLPKQDAHFEESSHGILHFIPHVLLPYKTATMKVLYADAKHMIAYTCFDDITSAFGTCPADHERIEVFSRRKNINSVDKKMLADVLVEKACVIRGTSVYVNHTRHCGYSTRKNQDKFEGRSCKVADYVSQDGFDQTQFSGTWYEVERTRFTADNVWESIVAHYDPVEKLFMRLMMSGTRAGECMGPFEAYIRPNSEQDPSDGDMTMWIGSRNSYGHPWSIRMNYKVIFTDYQTAIVYTCRHVNHEGKCDHHGEQIDVLSRTRHLDQDTRSKLYDIIKEKLCVDIHDLVVPAHEADCIQFVSTASEELNMDAPSAKADCLPVHCMMHCPEGFVEGSNGCQTCVCKARPINKIPELLDPMLCPIPMCYTFCQYGYREDERGCETCQCVEPPVEVFFGDLCRPFQCELLCPDGFEKDADNCDTCKCASPTIQPDEAENVIDPNSVQSVRRSQNGDGNFFNSFGHMMKRVAGYFS